MTFIGGVLHTLPFLISNVTHALHLAYFIVGLELFAIAWIRQKYFSSSFGVSLLQVVFGGLLVFLSGVFIGNS